MQMTPQVSMKYARFTQPLLVPNPKLFLQTRLGLRVYLQKCVSSKSELIRELQTGIARASTASLDDSGLGDDTGGGEEQDSIVEDESGQVRTGGE